MIFCNIMVLPTTKSSCTTLNYSIFPAFTGVARIMRRGNSISRVKTFCLSFSCNSQVLLSYQVATTPGLGVNAKNLTWLQGNWYWSRWVPSSKVHHALYSFSYTWQGPRNHQGVMDIVLTWGKLLKDFGGHKVCRGGRGLSGRRARGPILESQV